MIEKNSPGRMSLWGPDPWWKSPSAEGMLVSFMKRVPGADVPAGYTMTKSIGIFIESVIQRRPGIPEDQKIPRLLVLSDGIIYELEVWQVAPVD